MMRAVFILCIMTSSVLHAEKTVPRDAKNRNDAEDVIKPERTWKMSKKNFGYAIVAVVVKALLLIKITLAKLAILGNVSIMLSKLSLILSFVLTLGKYFGGLSKMLKLRPLGYDGQSSHHYPGHEDHGSYIT